MATILNDPNQYDKEKAQQQQVTAGQSATTSTGPTSTPTAAQPSFAPAPTSSGRFTNIQKYIQASQGSNLGGKIGSKLESERSNVAQNIGKSLAETQAAQQKAREQYAQGMSQSQFQPYVQSQIQAAQGLGAGGQLNQADVDKFAKIRQAMFTGPKGIENYGALQEQAQSQKQLAQQAGTESGQQALLSQYFSRPTYSTGQRRLDTLFLQSPEQQKQLAQARSTAGAPLAQLQRAQELAQAQGQQYAGEAKTAQEQAQKAIGEALGGKETELQTKATEATTAQEEMLKRMKEGLAKRQLSGADIQQLGLTPGQAIYGADPSQYFRATGLNPTVGTVASPEDYARYQALAKLAGQEATALPGQYNAAQAYTPQQAYQFSKDAFAQDVAGRKASFEDIGVSGQAQGIVDRSNAYQEGLNAFGPGFADTTRGQMLIDDITRERPKVANMARQYGFTGSDDEIIAKLVNQGALGGGTLQQV